MSLVTHILGLGTHEQRARQATVDWLMGRINYERTADVPYNERQLKLDRMRQLLTRLGQPDAGLKIVHVAGSKGKGSTAAMIAGILSAAGFRTGLFTSPHLERIEQRFAVDDRPCTAAELVALVDRVRPIVAAMDDEAEADGDPAGGPTFFEVVTAIALLHFVERQVDAAVLEVGLGGRLDSTNVCLPAVCVITSISFDHTKQLGHTLSAIAREKAGIIKPGVPVVCGVTEPEPQRVIAEVAREHGCRLIQLGRDFEFQYRTLMDTRQGEGETRRKPRQGDKETRRPGEKVRVSLSPGLPVSLSGEDVTTAHGAIDFTWDISGQEHQFAALLLAMRGRHQAANAAVALATIAELRHQGWCISADAMRLGLARTIVPARVEMMHLPLPMGRGQGREVVVVLDVAHNPASARALVNALGELPPPSRRTLILSISRDKDVRAIVAELTPHFDRMLVTQYQENPRAVRVDELAAIVREIAASVWEASPTPTVVPPEVTIRLTPADAWEHARESALPGELVCITGSFFLAAELRPLVLAAQAG